MTRSRFFTTALAVMMILSFTLTTAGAQAEAPEAGAIEPDVLIVDPDPIYPISYIFTKSPVFRFTQYQAVTKYRITVTKFDGTPYYTFKGNAACLESECSLTPTTSLTGKYGLVVGKGSYRWTVQAKTGVGTWTQKQDPPQDFAVVTTGFDSQFTTDKKNWQDIYGTWTWLTKGQLKNTGKLNEYTSVAHQHYITEDFTYEARFKLKSEHDYNLEMDHQAGGVIVAGGPRTLVGGQIWTNGVYVLIRNDQKACIFEYWRGEFVESTAVACETVDAIIPDGWNTLKVTVGDGYMLVSINGVYWRTYTDTAHDILAYDAFVGLTHVSRADVPEKMLVDWAKLELINSGGIE